MFSFLISFCSSLQTVNCNLADIPPTISGNPYVDYVSTQYIPNINLKEETPISITEVPVTTKTVPLSQVSSFLVSNGYSTQANADKIQSRLKFLTSISSSFNDFDCNDMSSNFNNLASDQKNENNFWNKIISRSSTLVKATKQGDNVTLTVKKVSGTMRKRWSKVISQANTHMYWCTVTDDDCGYKTEQQYKCETVTQQEYKCSQQPTQSYQCTGFGLSRTCGFKTTYQQKCGFQPVQKQSCGMKPVQTYRCDKKSSQKMFTKTYYLYKVAFTDSFNSTEVQDMFTSVQNQMKTRFTL